MGLDIYFYKVKNFKSDDMKSVLEKHKKQQTDKLTRFVKKSLKELTETINFVYTLSKIRYEGLDKFTKYSWIADGILKCKNIDEVEEWFNKFVKSFYPKYDAYFRKEWWIFEYFELEFGEGSAFVTKNDLDNLIEHAEYRLKDNVLTLKENKWYYDAMKDVKKQLTKLRTQFNEDKDTIIVQFSY